MSVSRRNFLKLAGLSLAGTGLASTPLPAMAKAASTSESASMLYDATKCVGCRACQAACKRRSNLPPETDAQGLYEAPNDLSAYTWTMIKLYKGDTETSFVKNQCMHCVEPACVSVCPVGALEKLESGPVVYHAERCIGCRYCMAACPFGIPKSQWDKSFPLIQKCDFCADRLANGEGPACEEACPTGAIAYGKRGRMLEVAHTRLQNDRNYHPYVYGESEVGGTSVLYISGVSFDKLGFPELKDEPLPKITWPYMMAVPWVVGAVASISTAIYFRTHRNEKKNNTEES
jgi:formate dehydrogenase iron-sulfur subunit